MQKYLIKLSSINGPFVVEERAAIEAIIKLLNELRLNYRFEKFNARQI